jgi:NAD(P)-dependent dehydrogenase (short-subunit alcohol dehydrogenase family)
MNDDLIEAVGAERFATWIPLGRVGSVDEVADVAAFLASDDSRYVSGSSIVVDGAYSSHLVRYEEV